AYSWSPDGERVAFIAAEPEEDEDPVLPYAPEIYEENLTDRRLWTATLDGSEPRLMEVPGTVYQVEWSPVGDRIAVAVAPTALVDDSYVNQRIRVLDAETGAVVTRIENPGKLGPMGWSPSGQYLAYISASSMNDPKEGRLMVADASTGAAFEVLTGYEGHVTSLVWEDDAVIRYTADRGVETVLERVRREAGAAPEALVPAGVAVFGDFSASRDGSTLAFAASSPQHPSELFVWTEGDDVPRRVTDTNPWLAEKRLAPQEVVEYEARDGLALQGLLIRPLDGQAPAPTIVVVHGGPEAHYSNGWLTAYSLLGQLGAARGFAVFYPNYRGSTGRGVEFSMVSQGDPAGAEFDDIVDGVDHLIEMGVADADAVGVTGGSYGGYATGWLTTRYTDRFAAGVMFVGISNKISKFGTSDIPNELYLVHDRKWPWDDYQFALERSPIYWAEGMNTPLLIMHGAEDPRVHPAQSLELYRALKLRGEAPVRLVLYPGEGHGNRSSTARYDYTLRSLRWFEHFLMEGGEDLPPSDLDALVEREQPEAMMGAAGSN
ncbi:MAG: S9 family peptidase, partial [Rhodothermales bacterium]|nr:S9 family peptidase [Rhodothermales bacterium]